MLLPRRTFGFLDLPRDSTRRFRQERVDRTLNKSPATSAEGFCLWAESELRSQKFKIHFKKIYEHKRFYFKIKGA